MSEKKSLGFIETFGLAACVAAADAAVKTANVKLLGFEYARGGGMCTVKVEGNVGACKAAVEAGKKAAEAVNGSLSGTKSVLLKGRPADGMRELLVDNRETVGGEIALAEGYRPKGDSKKPVLVKNWKPKKEENQTEKAPKPPVETSAVVEEVKEEEPTPEAPVEEAKEEEPTPEAPVEEAKEEEPTPEAPVEEAKEEEPTPEAPVEEAKEEEPTPEAPVEETKEEEPKEEKASDKKAETSKGKTSTGNRRSRSRRKKNTDHTDK